MCRLCHYNIVEFGFGGEVGEVATVRYGGRKFHGIMVGKGLSQMLVEESFTG